MRLYFQHACKDDLISAVEKITGQKVWAFVSGMDTEQDVATEIFYLQPTGQQ